MFTGYSRSHRRVANAYARQAAARTPASEKQVAFVTRLVAERDLTGLDVDPAALANLTKPRATRLIDALLRARKIDTARAAVPTVAAAEPVGPGYYRVAGSVYKVVPARTSGHLYAKVLVVETVPGGEATDGEDVSRGRWEYAAGAMRRITPTHRMTLDDAKAYGRTHGFCVACGALLTDPESVAAGIGPVCATRF